MGKGDDADPNRNLLVHRSREVVEGHDQVQNTSGEACCGMLLLRVPARHIVKLAPHRLDPLAPLFWQRFPARVPR